MSRDLNKEIEILIKQAKSIVSIYRIAAKKSGMSEGEFCIFYSLIVTKDITQKEICDAWSFPKQTVNSVISNLVKKGYISLENKEDNKNEKVIKITKSGKEYGEKAIKKIYEAEKRALMMMSEEEIENCIMLNEKYEKCLKKAIEE